MSYPRIETSLREARSYEHNLLITYDCQTGEFRYPSFYTGKRSEHRPIWKLLLEDGFATEQVAENIRKKIEELAASDKPQVFYTEYYLRNLNLGCRWNRVGFILPVAGGILSITFTDIEEEIVIRKRLEHRAEFDDLTGLRKRRSFCAKVEELLQAHADTAAAGGYAMVYFDIIRFKAINDRFGMEVGDKLLAHIAESIRSLLSPEDLSCRIGSDRFAIFTATSHFQPDSWISALLAKIDEYGLPIEIGLNAGIYVTTDSHIKPARMIDCAILAQLNIKGNYTVHYQYYRESLRDEMLTEHEIESMMTTSLSGSHYVVHFQPQYSHSTKMLIGAEALVRWQHPERGLISPGLFIPIFEKNGFITKLDFYVFRKVCAFLRSCIDKKLPLVPIAVNFSRHDIFEPNFVERLEAIRLEYDIPVRCIRLEITESAIAGETARINTVIEKLHDHGYIVEMDDFGSGYSSLNVLKDIDLDILKIDMKFLSKEVHSNRGGMILSSVIRMARWLQMPVIVEGVEEVEQADFLQSIGCDRIQGYLYARPMSEQAFEALLSHGETGFAIPQTEDTGCAKTYDFWDPNSLETLIFSNYAGPAAIIDYHHGKVEVLRLNKKYLQEIAMNLSEYDLITADPFIGFDAENRQIYLDMLERAIATDEEQECETWRNFSSSCCGDEKICIRSTVRMIGQNDKSYLIFAMIRNITAEKKEYAAMRENEQRFRVTGEQLQVYYWEYNIPTQEMHPCFRCMRDLGLPSVLPNYPESAFERGIFPPEVADMYRDWHKQLAQGVPKLEAIIPLTMERIPFHVRYTTEFDENGNPVKAYASAVPVEYPKN